MGKPCWIIRFYRKINNIPTDFSCDSTRRGSNASPNLLPEFYFYTSTYMYTNSFSLLTLAFLSVGFLQTAHSAEPPKGFVACDFTGSGIAADVELSDLSGSVEPVIVYSSSVQPKTLAQAKATLPAVVEIPNPVPIQIATTIVDTHRVVEAPATEQPVKPITVQVALVEAPQKEQRKSEPTMRLEWSRKSIQDIVLPNVELSEQVNSFDGATEATVQLVTRKMNRLSVQ